MAYELSKTYQLRTSDFDRYSRIQPAAVFDIFQDVAAVQADVMGIGYEEMVAQGVFWAVVRMKYEVVESPVIRQEVVARTWPHTPSRYSFQRDYSMADAEGNILVKASSEWVLMDFKERTLVRVADHWDGPHDFCEDRAFEKRIRKVHDFEAQEQGFVTVPGVSAVDANQHVNNARYGAYVLDALELAQDQAIRTFQLDFRHEVHPGQKLTIYTQTQDKTIAAKGVNEDGATAFGCAIELT